MIAAAEHIGKSNVKRVSSIVQDVDEAENSINVLSPAECPFADRSQPIKNAKINDKTTLKEIEYTFMSDDHFPKKSAIGSLKISFMFILISSPELSFS